MADNGANANIIMGFKAPEMPNPIDTAVKALTMKNLMQENQTGALKLTEQQRQLSDQSALRSAFKNNTIADENGNPVVNRQGVMSDLMKANPMLAQKQALDFRQMDLDKTTQQHAIAKQILFGIDPSDQASLDTARAQAQKAGLPPLKLPDSVDDPRFTKALKDTQMLSLDHGEQLAQANKQQELALQKQTKDLEIAKLNHEINQHASDKKQEANQQVVQAFESGRQAPDAAQALKDRQSASKLNELVNSAKDKDPNNLSDSQVRLVVGEAAKMGLGGIPGEADMEKMDTSTLARMAAKGLSRVNNKPEAANAGEFVKQFQDYANGIAQTGGKLLKDRQNRVLEEKKDYLSKSDYDKFKGNISKEFADVKEDASKDVADYAKKHGITVDQAAAIKAARTKVAGP